MDYDNRRSLVMAFAEMEDLFRRSELSNSRILVMTSAEMEDLLRRAELNSVNPNLSEDRRKYYAGMADGVRRCLRIFKKNR